MTLRLFGKRTRPKPTEAAQEKQAQAPARTAERPSRRRRAGSSTREQPPPEATSEAKPAKRTRRGRRGGVRRSAARKAQAAAQEQPPAQRATAVAKAPVRSDGTGIEALLATQDALVEQIERQSAALQNLQGALSAIENRLTQTPSGSDGALRVGIFVDVPNIMYAAERARAKIDYEKMLALLVRGRRLVRASAYAPISDDPDEPIKSQRFVQPFMAHGYAMVTKPLKRYADGTIKANFDVELAIDVLTVCERLDVVIIVSGDGDFRRLVELVTGRGVRVEVAAFGESTAAELRNVADEYIDLKAHLTELRAK